MDDRARDCRRSHRPEDPGGGARGGPPRSAGRGRTARVRHRRRRRRPGAGQAALCRLRQPALLPRHARPRRGRGPADVALVGDEAAIGGAIAELGDAGATEFVGSVFGSEDERSRTVACLAALARAAPRSDERPGIGPVVVAWRGVAALAKQRDAPGAGAPDIRPARGPLRPDRGIFSAHKLGTRRASRAAAPRRRSPTSRSGAWSLDGSRGRGRSPRYGPPVDEEMAALSVGVVRQQVEGGDPRSCPRLRDRRAT